MTPLTRRAARFVLSEARDWIFAVAALFAALVIPSWTGGDWFLTGIVLAGFVVLYVGALFLSARWFRGPDSQRPGNER